MAWRETERAKAVKVRRTYRCTDCTTEFTWVHESEEEAPPECPICAVAPAAAGDTPAVAPSSVVWQPPLPGVLTVKSRAIDYTQSMVEKQYGLTNFNDNQRVGDIGYKPPPPMQTAERETAMKELVEAQIPVETSKQIIEAASNFWQGNMGAATTEQTLGQRTVAAEASAAARAAGVDPIAILETDRQRASMRAGPGYAVAAAVKG